MANEINAQEMEKVKIFSEKIAKVRQIGRAHV